MGTRYEFEDNCPHCGAENNIYFAPTCGFFSQECHFCKERFWIGDNLTLYMKPIQIDMRLHSTWGDRFEEKTGIPNLQTPD